MKPRFLALSILAAVLLVSGCTTVSNNDGAPDAMSRCQDRCIQLVPTKTDFSLGPCLDDNIAPGWVCDMAHEPRQPVDEDPANQCPSFGTAAHHFVEVNENCRVIKVV